MNWFRSLKSSVFVAAAAVASLSAVAPSATGDSGRQAPITEVVFIGTHHTLSFLHPGYSPSHLRALLSKVAPVALCVELTPEWRREEGIPTFPQELYAALTWAQLRGVPTVGVNSLPAEIQLPFPVARINEAALHDGPRLSEALAGLRGGILWQALQAFGGTGNDLENYQRSLLPGGREWPAEDKSAAERDDRIVKNLGPVLARFVGKRVAIVYGSDHYMPIKRRLEVAGGSVRVVTAIEFLPIEAERVEASWHPDDAIMLLGTNLDDWRALAAPHARNHQRTRQLLDRLKRERPDSVITRYFEARWNMLFGDLAGGRSLLRQIADSEGSTTLPYVSEPRWSWPPFRTFEQKARYYLGVAADLADDHAAAVKEYEQLLRLPDDQLVVPGLPLQRMDLRPFLQSLITTPYRDGIFEAYRALLAQRTRP